LEKKVFRILAIDGGGILGLYSAKIIEFIKKEFLKSTELYDYFDLITGCSTGGIIALGISGGIEIDRIVEFYEKYGSQIFPNNKLNHGLSSLRIFFQNKYSNIYFEKVVTKFFDDLKISDARCKLCIPVIDAANCQPIVFKTSHHPSLSRDNNLLMKDVALATSAAPTFFPLYSFGNYSALVDGGLWQNNPSLIAVIEACNLFVGDNKAYDEIEILSIGNPHTNINKTISFRNNTSSLFKWKSNLIELPMKVSSKSIDQILSFLQKNNSLYIKKYLRLATQNIPTDRYKFSIDFASKEAIKEIMNLAYTDFYKEKKNINEFLGGTNA
jgi:patatin-like phospholipase/acyl hydrolase